MAAGPHRNLFGNHYDGCVAFLGHPDEQLKRSHRIAVTLHDNAFGLADAVAADLMLAVGRD